MHVGRGCIERDLHAVSSQVWQHTVDTISRGFEPHIPRPGETLRLGINANHPDRLQYRTPLKFVHQIGANIARPDQCTFDFIHSHFLPARLSDFLI